MDKSNIEYLRSCNPSKTTAMIQEQLSAWVNDENTCHYFAIQISGQELHPYGKLGRPFYDLDQAIRKLEDLKAKQPDVDFYIGYGAFDTDFLDFESEDLSMHERIWINKHDWRIGRLKVAKMNLDELLELQPDYCEIKTWEAENNLKDRCHYYVAKDIKKDHPVGMSSQCFFDLKDAIAAREHFSKIMPDREFKVFKNLMTTENLLEMDDNTEWSFQLLVDKHKARLELLNKGDSNE